MADILKEYLVKLGFKVDNQQYNQFKKMLNDAQDGTKKFSNSTVASMASSELAILSFVASANVGIASFINSLAKADMDTDIFSRRMWVTADQGKAIQESLKATGRSMEDIWFSPELREQFTELQKVAYSMKPPEDFKNQMKEVRNVQLEFMKLRVILAYAMQHIGYYLTKYLAEPMAKIKKAVVELNAYLKANMPTISSDIAKFLSNFVRLGEAAIWAISKLIKMIVSLPDNVKIMGAALAAVFVMIASGPMGMMLTGLSLLMLLLEDFYTYSEGGKSAMPGLWSWMTTSFGEGSKTANELSETFSNLSDTIDILKGALLDLYNVFGNNAKWEDFMKSLGDFVQVDGLIHTLNDDLKLMNDILRESIKLFKEMLGYKVDEEPKKPGEKGLGARITDFLLGPGVSDTINMMFGGGSPVPNAKAPSQSGNLTVQNTNNIYGTDPYAVASQVDRNWQMNATLIRDVQGVFR